MVDSGASHHMCDNQQAFQLASLRPATHTIRLGDCTVVSAAGKGVISVKGVTIEALFVPAFRVSLLSVSKLDKLGWTTTFSNGLCSVLDSRGASLLHIRVIDGLDKFNVGEATALATTRSMASANLGRPAPATVPTTRLLNNKPAGAKPKRQSLVLPLAANRHVDQTPTYCLPPVHRAKLDNSFTTWRRHLAHLHCDAMPKALRGMPSHGPRPAICVVSIQSKFPQTIERSQAQHSQVPFELVHSDLANPFKVSNGGAAYYIIYVDDCTRFVVVFILVDKTATEICAKFATFKAWIETKGFRIKRFRCDNGTGEYNNKDFLQTLSANGIVENSNGSLVLPARLEKRTLSRLVAAEYSFRSPSL